ncbi:MAG: sugar kinase [Burkholderiales bacterium]|nr:sugar kinase [Burkholderiales bacterium]
MSAPAVVALGEPMVEFNQTRPGEHNYLQGFGGDTSNAIIACARQGASTAYLTRLGDDDFGRQLLQLWADEGVSTNGVGIDADAHTAVYFVSHGPDGHRFDYLRRGSAASRMTPDWLPRDLITGARFLHVSAVSQAISQNAAETVAAAIQAARSAGVTVCYDTNLRLKLWSLERAREVIGATIGDTDYLLPSIDDLAALCARDSPDAILDWCFAQGARHVVLKLGAAGCIAATADARVAIPGHAVAAVDATGAGDCFDGAFIARLLAGDSLVSAARYANAAAALTTTGYGAVAPLPRPDAVLRLLESSTS